MRRGALAQILLETYFRPITNSVWSVKWWSQRANRAIPRVTSYEGDENANINNQYDADHKIVLDWHRYGERSKLICRSALIFKQLDYISQFFIDGLGYQYDVYSESRQRSALNSLEYNIRILKNYSFNARLNLDYHSVNTRDSVIQKEIYHANRFDFSLFLSGKASFFNRINLNLMLRQDFIDAKSSVLIPFFGFDYRIVKNSEWIIKGNIARNYRHPSLNDLYWQPGGNSRLKPEKGTGIELGAEYRIKKKVFDLRGGIQFFRNDIDDWITWLPTFKGYWEPFNIDRVLSKGLETNLQTFFKVGKFTCNTLCSWSYTSSVNYGKTEIWGDESYGKQLPFIPLHSGNLFASVSYSGFKLAWQYNAYSEQFTTTASDKSKRYWLYPYFMNDLSIGKILKINKITIDLTFKIYNLFDETYHTILYRPMPGRNFHLMVGMVF
jgi:iron complex outermembrane receptor protein